MKVLSANGRKWLLVLHLLFSGIMFGTAAIFLALSIAAAVTNDEHVLRACYTVMHVLADTTVRGSTIATLVTGALLSVRTRWGLFRFYWIIAKEGLTLLAIALGPFGMYVWTLKAVRLTTVEGMGVWHDPVFTVNNAQLWTGIILQLISLAAAFILSVFKPWGQRQKNGQSKTNLAS